MFPSSEAPRFFDIAGKVFLLGEYSVLIGSPALIASVGPRFKLTLSNSGAAGSQHPFPSGSPAARLCEQAPLSLRAGAEFLDPHGGAGGFGASTAQFALAYAALQASPLEEDVQKVWQAYRELTSADAKDGGFPPSGADLAAQWMGGACVFHPHHGQLIERLDPRSFNSGDWLIFSAAHQPDRKVVTHTHLGKIGEPGSSLHDSTWNHSVTNQVRHALDAIRADDLTALAQAMVRFTDLLALAGFEHPLAARDRQALSALPSVLAVKGAGAMMADTVVVLMDRDASIGARRQMIQEAHRRNLQLVADGLPWEPGLRLIQEEGGS